MVRKKLFYVFFGLFLFGIFSCSSCSIQKELKNLPAIQCKEFEYSRGGNITSVRITAKNSKITKCTNSFDSINIDANYPWITFSFKAKGYKRKLNNCEE